MSMKVSTLVLAGFVVVGMCQSLGAQTSGDELVSKRVDELGVDQVFDRVHVCDGELKEIHSFYYPQPNQTTGVP
jgi:hypothetical protein